MVLNLAINANLATVYKHVRDLAFSGLIYRFGPLFGWLFGPLFGWLFGPRFGYFRPYFPILVLYLSLPRPRAAVSLRVGNMMRIAVLAHMAHGFVPEGGQWHAVRDSHGCLFLLEGGR